MPLAGRSQSFTKFRFASQVVRRAVGGVLVLVCCAVMPGCGPSGPARLPVHPVSGSLTFQGKPLANALLVLHPKTKDPERPFSARAQTDANGAFKVTTYDQDDGAPAGEYAVTVQYYQLVGQGGSFEPGPNVLAPKLSTPETTDITVRVAEGPNTLAPIEVAR